MDQHTKDIAREVLQRVTRIESRICRLGDVMGADLRSSDKGLKVIAQTDTTVSVTTRVLDVAVSQILRFLTTEGIEGKVVLVYHDGHLLARIYPRS